MDGEADDAKILAALQGKIKNPSGMGEFSAGTAEC
jgi:hypothetical protein